MQAESLCLRPLEERDAAALIGILAALSASSMLDQLGDALREQLERRPLRDGLLTGTASPQALQVALEDLVERIRSALGEYDTLPSRSQL